LISEKGKRKLEYQGNVYYWYIENDKDGVPKMRIISDDKKLQLTRGFDSEMVISSMYIKEVLKKHFTK